MRVIFTILLVNTCICTSVWGAINQDTPNLSFENGEGSFPATFDDEELGVWKRYYGFYGADDFGAKMIVNKISNHKCYSRRVTGSAGDEDGDGWVKYGTTLNYNITGDCKDENNNVIYTLGNNFYYQKYYNNNGSLYQINGTSTLSFRGQEPQGSFTVINDRTLDPCVYPNQECESKVPFYTMPTKIVNGQRVVNLEDGQKVV